MNKHALFPALFAGVCCVSIAYTADLGQMPIVGGQASVTTVATSGTVPAGDVQYSKMAVLRLLDKQTNRVDHLTVEAGKSQRWAGLTVTMSKCAWGIGGVPVQDASWLDIVAGSGEPEFHGWMFNTFPSVATYDHSRFDVALEKCVRPTGYTAPAPARVAPATPSGPEKEGGDDEAPQGGNPGVDSEFIVPGINGASPPPVTDVPTPVVPATQPAAPAQLDDAPEAVPQSPPPAVEEPQPAEPAQQPEPAQPQQGGDQQQLQRMMDTPTQGQ